jgi:hypothetical protein
VVSFTSNGNEEYSKVNHKQLSNKVPLAKELVAKAKKEDAEVDLSQSSNIGSLPKELVKILLSFLQKKPGRISLDGLALASTCRRFWNVAASCNDQSAPTRIFYTAIIDILPTRNDTHTIYTSPEIAFCFERIAGRWIKAPFRVTGSYDRCFDEVKNKLKASSFIIVEVSLPFSALTKSESEGWYDIRARAMAPSSIQRVSYISSLSRPMFLTAKKGILPAVDRTLVDNPKDFDNATFSQPMVPLPTLNTLKI